MLVDRSLQPVRDDSEHNPHLVEVPNASSFRFYGAATPLSQVRDELPAPRPYRFVTDLAASLK